MPYVIAKGSWDAPHGWGGGLSVFVHPRWSVDADVSHRGPFGLVYGIGAHYWPWARRWRMGQTTDQFNFGVGGGALFTKADASGGLAALIMPISIDLQYLLRPIQRFGVVLGSKFGFGVAFEARDFGDHPRGGSVGDHLGFVTIQYVGVSFGSHGRR